MTTPATTQELRLDRHATAGDTIAAYLRTHADRLRAAELAVRTGEPDGVHDMRVAVRRLRSVLRSFRSVYGKAERARAAELATELKWVSDVLGDARDTAVRATRLAAEIAATPTELVLGPVPALVDRYLTKDAAHARDALVTATDTQRYARLLLALDMFVAIPAKGGATGRRATDVLPRLVHRTYRRARKAADAAQAATGVDRDGALHRVRRAVKRLRYATEAVTPVAGAGADRYRRRCRAVQRTLGDHHDFVVLRSTLRELGIRAHGESANAFTFGLLHGRMGMAAQSRERAFPQQWHRIARGKARRWMTH